MNTPNVLIVDDDPALLNALPETLRLRLGPMSIDTCDSARTAITRITESDYDAIVSDIKMPGMDGLALLAEVKALRPDVPTLLITGHGEHDLALQALRAGAYDFVQKPIDREYFVAALSRAIQMRQMSRQIENQRSALERYASELERIVEERTHELREANRIKDEFLATLSHELRTPLNSILGWAQLLRGGALSGEAAQRALQTVVRNTKSLAQIIDDLLDVSRIITGKLRLEARQFELAPVIEAAIDALRLATDAKGINLSVGIEPDVGIILGDTSRIQQVVWNLLSNAIKFTPNGGSVEVRLERVGPEAIITVTDTGEGIREDFLPYVFDRFRQGDSTFTRRHGGLGLGLAIVRHIVELHGGSVSARSEGKGRGALFNVSLPLSHITERVPVHTTVRAFCDPAWLDGVHVLIVDDDADARDLLRAALETRGANVTALPSVAELMNWLGLNPAPDVLVSDIGMPDEDGFELIKKLRENTSEQFAGIPAVALTAYARPEDQLKVLSSGYQVHLPKPVEPDGLARVVADLAFEGSKRKLRQIGGRA
ncbi:MAG TPA: response regulator [Blastocatellia bacterium]|nr:response regulator [Blastocatellia bacterium]